MMLDKQSATRPGPGKADGLSGGKVDADRRSPPRASLEGLRNFPFHQLVALVEMRNGGLRVGSTADPQHEYIRFRSTRSLSFGPGDISEVTYDDGVDRLDVRINFLGLYGPASPLPPYYTERIIEEDQIPSAVEDLLDLFNHRLISLLHVVWRKYRYYLRYDPGGTDPLSRRFLALCGFPIEDRERIGEISRAALLPHVGLMSLYSGSAEVTAATLSNFFKIPCAIEEFVSRTVAIPEDSRLRLGTANNRLGEDAILGFELTDDLGKFRVCLGESAFDDLASFLPHGNRHQQMSELLAMINREPLEWDIRFAFQPQTVPAARLGESRLGWSGWLHASDPECIESTIHLVAIGRDHETLPRAPQSDIPAHAAHEMADEIDPRRAAGTQAMSVAP